MATVKVLSLVVAFMWLGYLGAYTADRLGEWTFDGPPEVINVVETREA